MLLYYFIICIALLVKQDGNELNVRAPDMPYIVPAMMYGSFLHIGYRGGSASVQLSSRKPLHIIVFSSQGAETIIVDSLNHQINSSGLLRFYSLPAIMVRYQYSNASTHKCDLAESYRAL